MKKLFTIICLFTITTAGMLAQDNPFAGMSKFHFIFFPSNLQYMYNINYTDIEQDLRIDDTNFFLYNWVGDGSEYVLSPGTGIGYYGQIGEYLDAVVVQGGGWSGLGFCLDSQSPKQVDFTKVTGEYRLHILAKSTYQRPHVMKFLTGPGGYQAPGAKITIGVGNLSDYPKNVAPNITRNFKTDGTWNVIDISIQDLRDIYGVIWSPRAPYGGQNQSVVPPVNNNYFEMLSGDGPSDISIDCIFFYKPTSNGLDNTKTDKLSVLVTARAVEVLNSKAPVEVYDLAGVKVKTSVEPVFGTEDLNKGVYIIKSDGLVAKVLIE
ncbi:MAG: hypothetical protein FWD60_01770 [Candidatus Azobacteroides sp.]|nr:hypothetical protein [Candidatus Azobacteroides sp.]